MRDDMKIGAGRHFSFFPERNGRQKKKTRLTRGGGGGGGGLVCEFAGTATVG